MNNTPDIFDNLFRFSPKIDDDDLYVPSTQPASSSNVIFNHTPLPSHPHPTPDDFIVFSQNAHRNNASVHAILSVASSMSPPADLILIQEPYYGKVGTNTGMAQGNPIYDIYGCPKHQHWQVLLPDGSAPDNKPDVLIYVPNRRTKWTFHLRSDIVSAKGLMCVEIRSSSNPFLVFNVYNDTDNGACDLIASLNNVLPRALFIGNFNLHHPLWARDDNLNKHSERAERLVEHMASNGYAILNNHGEETFSIYRKTKSGPRHLYTSTLDLAWASGELSHFVKDFQVARHLCVGSDHYPLKVTLSYSQAPHTRDAFQFKEDNHDAWAKAFHKELAKRKDIPEHIHTEEEFNDAVDSLTGATLAASHLTCLRKPPVAKRARWFDSKVREALQDVRKSRKRLRHQPNQHNALRYEVARKQLHYQVKVAKRSHARAFASSVKPGSDLWRLTSWYQGIRKTTIPTLKDPANPDPISPTWVTDAEQKAELLASSWFPNHTPPTKPLPHAHPARPTREWTSITNEEVLDTLKDCASDNAPGLSGLSYRVWKWVAEQAPDELITIVRAALNHGFHHSSWKQSLVAVIPKNNKKDMALPKSHRPIQLIECLGKLVEKIAAKRITFELGKYELLPFNQFGGRSNSSCLDAGLSLCHDIMEARDRDLVSSFLAIDIKGFFDHVGHERLLEVLHHWGFSPNFVRWVEMFLSGRFVRVQVDDHVRRPHPQNVGLPQGSPISPVLACIFAAALLEHLNKNPVFDETATLTVPVGPRGYVDDFGFHASSTDLETSTHLCKITLERAVDILDHIGLTIDPDKCDLMHFSWRQGDSSNPTQKTKLYGKEVRITPPASIRWLGFHLDRKLSFHHHVNLLASKGDAIVQGLRVLGNSIDGISPSNLRLLYNTVVIPAITYGSQLWFVPSKPKKKLVEKLEKVQRKALIAISGGFWDSPTEAMQLLTFIPPITSTLTKLHRSASLRIPRLPVSSEITRRLPADHLIHERLNRWLIPPKHIPFSRPLLAKVTHTAWSPLNRMAANLPPGIERADPFHSQNAPSSHKMQSLPFNLRFSINNTPCPKKDKKSYVANQRMWLTTRTGRETLCVFTDGSKTNKAAGWAVTGIHAGLVLFTHQVPFAKRASNHDAEMMAMGHASKLVLDTMLGKPDIRKFRIFSDSTATLTSIFNPGPHAAQQASLMFRANMLELFTKRSDITGDLVWTPGHGGLHHMNITDKNAKRAANSNIVNSKRLFPLFVSRSSALEEVNTLALKEWHTHLDNLEDKKEGIFRETEGRIPRSGFRPFADQRRFAAFGKTKPAKWFKSITRPLMSQLTQMCTNHAPTGEYFRFAVWKYQNKPREFYQCSCRLPPHNYPPTLQTREHIIRACPIFEDARERLRRVFPGVDKPRVSIGKMVRKQTIEHTLEYLKAGPFSRKHAPHEPP